MQGSFDDSTRKFYILDKVQGPFDDSTRKFYILDKSVEIDGGHFSR